MSHPLPSILSKYLQNQYLECFLGGSRRSVCVGLRWVLRFVVINLTSDQTLQAAIMFVPLNSLTFPRPPRGMPATQSRGPIESTLQEAPPTLEPPLSKLIKKNKKQMKLLVKNEGGREGGKAGDDGRAELSGAFKKKKNKRIGLHETPSHLFQSCREEEGVRKRVAFSLPTRPIRRDS